MPLLARTLTLNNIVLDLPATSKKRVFEQAGLLFENHHGLERAAVFEALFTRERLGSTALGFGVSLPHGRIKGLRSPIAAFMRTTKAIAFDAPDGQAVNQFLILLVPEAATQQHLDILAEIAHRLSDETLRARLNSESDAQVIFNLLTTGAQQPHQSQAM
jgi:PTS system nitrogen regulatory IIA component